MMQQEIIKKTKNSHNKIKKKTPSFALNNLLKECKHINEQIPIVYHQLRD